MTNASISPLTVCADYV